MSCDDVKLLRHRDAGIVWFHEPVIWVPESQLARNAYCLGPTWSCVVFLDRDDDTYYNGKLASGLYSARFGRRATNLRDRIADFLRYERDWGRQVVVATEYPMDVAGFVADALSSTPSPERLRPYDPAVVVHSTTREGWPQIAGDGRLLSASELGKAGVDIPEIGFETFGEPAEYREFIHFSPLGNPNGEVVVLSHQRGTVVTDFEAAYIPGTRIYLDAHLMIRDGVAVRDGLHVLKVHLALELEPYLIDVITAQDLGNGGEAWSPRRFASEADGEFCKRHPAVKQSRSSSQRDQNAQPAQI
jgi:hypothetical protein